MAFSRDCYRYLLVLFAGLMLMSSARKSSAYDEPVYYLKFSIAQVAAEVRLNDIPVLSHGAQGKTTSEKPVPESVVDGENVLMVKISPLDQHDRLFIGGSSADVSLIVREKAAPIDQYETLIHLNIDAAENSDKILDRSEPRHGNQLPVVVVLNKNEIAARRSTIIDSPFPRWEWQDGVKIENSPANFNSLLRKYRAIHSALKSEDIERIKDLYSTAAKEFATAYHHYDVEQGHRIINTTGLVLDSGWELGDIEYFLQDEELGLKLDIFANGKLARIVDKDGDELLIVYRDDDAELYSFQKFGFFKNESGEWIMAR